MRVLVVNAGSSTVKLTVLDDQDGVVADARVDPWDGASTSVDLPALLPDLGAVEAVGHRVVHGGRDLTSAMQIDGPVEQAIAALTPLAPLHQPRALAALAAARRALPDAVHVACFDTAFHATMPAAARTYALPQAWRERWGLDRFGFHGLSHAWVARHAPGIAGVPPSARIVSCHLGAGASLCAIVEGRSVDTTMGFTPLDGLVMATRSGAVDPGVLLWLLAHTDLDAAALADGLEHGAGLAGLSGGSGDMREVLARRAIGDGEAGLAFDVYVHRLGQGIAAMATSLGGLDLLAFTGGVGEHAHLVRDAVASRLGFLGVGIDGAASEAAAVDSDISAPGAPVRTVVVTAREDLEVASQVRRLLRS